MHKRHVASCVEADIMPLENPVQGILPGEIQQDLACYHFGNDQDDKITLFSPGSTFAVVVVIAGMNDQYFCFWREDLPLYYFLQ